MLPWRQGGRRKAHSGCGTCILRQFKEIHFTTGARGAPHAHYKYRKVSIRVMVTGWSGKAQSFPSH